MNGYSAQGTRLTESHCLDVLKPSIGCRLEAATPGVIPQVTRFVMSKYIATEVTVTITYKMSKAPAGGVFVLQYGNAQNQNAEFTIFDPEKFDSGTIYSLVPYAFDDYRLTIKKNFNGLQGIALVNGTDTDMTDVTILVVPSTKAVAERHNR